MFGSFWSLKDYIFLLKDREYSVFVVNVYLARVHVLTLFISLKYIKNCKEFVNGVF